jgi:hypothetical protein
MHYTYSHVKKAYQALAETRDHVKIPHHGDSLARKQLSVRGLHASYPQASPLKPSNRSCKSGKAGPQRNNKNFLRINLHLQTSRSPSTEQKPCSSGVATWGSQPVQASLKPESAQIQGPQKNRQSPRWMARTCRHALHTSLEKRVEPCTNYVEPSYPG